MADWYVAFFVKAARRSCTPACLSSHENAHACQNKNRWDQQRMRKGKAERTMKEYIEVGRQCLPNIHLVFISLHFPFFSHLQLLNIRELSHHNGNGDEIVTNLHIERLKTVVACALHKHFSILFISQQLFSCLPTLTT